MEIEYPHPFKPITHSQKQTKPIEEDPEPVTVPVAPVQSQVQPPKTPKPQLTKEERKKKQKEADIEATRKRLASGKGKAVHVHKLSYPSVMPKVCTKDGQELFFATNVIIDMASAGIKTKAWCCLKCKTAYIPKEDQEVIREKLRKADMRQSLKGNTVLQKVAPVPAPDPNEPVNLAIPQNTLYVCKGLISCNRNSHSVESATGIMLAKNGSIIKINTNFCPQCRKYFISHDEYMRYRKLYGILLGNIKVTNGSFVGAETDLAEESILHMCGYSVNQTDNLSPAVLSCCIIL